MVKNIEKYFFKPKRVDEIIHTANIVFDTNALLSAYQWKEVVFHEVLKVLQKLSDEDKLKIPPQVFKEFIHQRPLRIAEAIEKVDELLKNIQNPKKLEPTLPLLGLIDNIGKYAKSERSYTESRENYKNELKELIKRLKEFFNDDIVLDSLKPLFQQINFNQADREGDITKVAKNRAAEKLPPLTGGDGGKKENQYGDYFVWDYILSLEGDVIFVTTDFKEDWFHQIGSGKEKTPVSPRRELIEEFYEVSAGGTFSIISLKDFMQKYNPNLDEDIVDNLMAVEKNKITASYEMICTAIRDLRLLSVYDDVSERLDFFSPHYEIFVQGFNVDSINFKPGEYFYLFINMQDDISIDALHRIINEKNPLFKVDNSRQIQPLQIFYKSSD